MLKFKLFAIFLFLLSAVFSGYLAWQIHWTQPSEGAPIMSIEIPAGAGVRDVARALREGGIIKHQWLFKWYLSRRNLDTKLQTGFFDLRPGMNIKAIALMLTNPESGTAKLLFREGLNVRDYGYVLEYSGLAQAEELQELAGFPAVDYRFSRDMPLPKDFSADFDFLRDKPKHLGLEGYLFPDTYFFRKNAAPEEIVRRLLENFGGKLTPELRSEISRQKRTIHEVVTMASLIEAEARFDEERGLISDVLRRRLAIGMPLQLDSTVNYITGGKKPAISLAEKEIDSPYNTYKYRGLPPGPINNPGLSSILAAIYPVKNDYWFFLADKEGEIHFAKTLDEHNELKWKYLK